METQEINAQKIAGQYRLKKAAVAAVSLALLVVAASVAYVLCSLQLKNVTQEILSSQRDMQQAWVDKSLESIRAWRSGLVEQARFVSTAEMFRLFAMDVRSLGPDGQQNLAAPDAEESSDETLRNMAEQMRYMQDLLRDFVNSRQWISARIVSPDGKPVVIQDQDIPLGEEQLVLVRRAVAEKTIAFGPVRALGDTLVMDMADPMYEVLGRGEDKPVAALLSTVPVAAPLSDFLAQNQDQHRELLPRILQRTRAGQEAILLRGGKATLNPTPFVPTDGNLAFKRRQALAGASEVYSLGSYLSGLNWWVVLEVPADITEGLIDGQARQIYGLGVLGSLGTALLLAFIWASLVSRSHRATSRHFQSLYTLIRQQKLMLDSINASLQVGLLLIDRQGNIKMFNPAFCQMAGKSEEKLHSLGLAEALPQEAAATLLQGMEQVSDSGKEGSLEISLPQSDDIRLFRVTLFPFEDQVQDASASVHGCVGIFQDITEFRRRAEEARKRQASIIGALVRAIESVDSNLIGHSQKMEHVVELFSDGVDLAGKDRETLRLAARLSQVGKIFVPRHLLTKTGKLTPDEQQEVMRAPEYAYRALRDLQFGLPVPEAVYQMGERLDGTGQPRQLEGDAITPNARILAVVNAFCAMVSPRSYRAGMRPEEAIGLLEQDAGFDQTIVAQLAALPTEALQKAIAANATEQPSGAAGRMEDR